MQQWCVTITGVVQPGVEPESAWRNVLAELGGAAEDFRQRIRQRVPVSFRSVDKDAAAAQFEALQRCGVEVVLLADEGVRIWVHRDGTSCGPVALAWARQQRDAGAWDESVLACREGESRWQPLAAVIAADAMAPPPPPASVPAAGSAAAPREALVLLPVQVAGTGLHAGFWLRLGAYFIDTLIASAAMFVLTLVAGLVVTLIFGAVGRGGSVVMALILYPAIVIGMWLYFALFESSSRQATPGKMALRLRVTDVYGRRIGFAQASGRFFGKLLSGLILEIGYLMIGWTERKQGLHDLLANCCVVRQDRLESWRRGEAGPTQPGAGLSGWVVTLIVIAAIVTLAIPTLAIVAAIAVPSYQNYLVRAQVAEGLVLADGAKASVARYVLTEGTMPADNRAAGLDAPHTIGGHYVDSVAVVDGQIIITYGGSAVSTTIRDDRLVLTPRRSDHKVTWTCRSTEINPRYLPPRCRP